MSATDSTPSNDANTRRIRLPSPGTLLLGTLLLIVCAVAIPIGMRYQRQQELIEYIELQGGIVETDDSAPAWVHELLARILGEDRARGFDEIVAVTVVSKEILPRLRGLTSIRRVNIGFLSPEADIDLQPLSSLESLEELSFFATDAGDQEMRQLSGLTNLRILDLRLSQVRDEGLQHLRGLENLETLHLGNTRCSGDGIEELRSQLPNCEIDTAPIF